MVIKTESGGIFPVVSLYLSSVHNVWEGLVRIVLLENKIKKEKSEIFSLDNKMYT